METHHALASSPLPLSEGLASLLDVNNRREAPEQPRIEEIRFHHLRSAHDIAQVLHLREELRLPAASRADPGFAAREKKEMKPASSVRLPGAANSSEPSATFPLTPA